MAKKLDPIVPVNYQPLDKPKPVEMGLPVVGALDRATQEVIGLDDVTKLGDSLQGNLEDSSFVLEATKMMAAEISSESLQRAFTMEISSAESEEQMVQILDKYQRLINKTNVDARMLSYVDYLKRVPPDLYSWDAYDRYVTEFTTPESAQNLRYQLGEETLAEMRKQVTEFSEEYAMEGFRETAGEFIQTILAPFAEQIMNNAAKQAGVPLSLWDEAWAGSGKEAVREYLANLPEAEKVEFQRSILEYIKEKAQDPVLGVLLSDFQILDYAHSILGNEDVLTGKDPLSTPEKWIANITTVLDMLYVGGILGRLIARTGGTVGTMRAAFTNRGSRQTMSTAQRIGGPKARDIITTLRNDPEVNKAMGFPAEETVAGRLPGPKSVEEDMRVVPDDDLPPGMDSTIAELEARRAEVRKLASQVPRSWVTPADKVRIAELEIQALSNATSGVMRIGSSTYRNLPENEGIEVSVLIGATDSSGYKGIAGLRDIVNLMSEVDLLRIDAEVMLRQPDGTLISVLEVPKIDDFNMQLQYLRQGALDLRDQIGPNSEFYLKLGQTKYWNADDKFLFGNNPVFRSGSISNPFMPNFAKYDETIFQSTLHAFSTEQAITEAFDRMLRPLWKLSADDKRFIDSTFPWLDEFVKQHGRNPGYTDYRTAFPEITEKQLRGLLTLRHANDTMWQLLNHKVYKDYKNRGFISAMHDTLPTYHGRPLDIGEASRISAFYDPVSRKGVRLAQSDLDQLYNDGGSILELPLPEQIGRRFYDYTIIDKAVGYNKVGLLDTVLPYHPGYYVKVPTDAYYIAKRYRTIERNGEVKTAKLVGETREDFIVPVRTTDSEARGSRIVEAMNSRHFARNPDSDYEWVVVRAQDLGGRDLASTLATTLYQQGRMFFDKRDLRRMKNIDGGPATYLDLVRGLELGIQALSKTLTMEEQVQVLKQAWARQYGNTVDNYEHVLLNADEVSRRLESRSMEGLSLAERRHHKQAREFWDHIISLQGAGNSMYEKVKTWALDTSVYLNRRLFDELPEDGQLPKRRPIAAAVEKAIMDAMPIEFTRSAVFKAFMATRPGRQLILQSLQITSLAGLDPGYILTGKFIKDTIALRIGLFKSQGLPLEWSDADLARFMGISKKDYKLLVDRINASGIQLHAGVSTLSTGNRALKRGKLAGSKAGDIAQMPGRIVGAGFETLQKVGFDTGERNNLIATYMLALRRFMKAKGYERYQDLSLEDWDTVAGDTSYLALNMIKPGEMKYQRGLLSIPTQFVSFMNKQIITLMGYNPKISRKVALTRILPALIVLWGPASLGIKDQVTEWVGAQDDLDSSNQVRDLAVDVITGGLIETMVDQAGGLLDENWKDLDLSGLAPGIGGYQILMEHMLDAAATGTVGDLVLGPTASLSSNVIRGLSATRTLLQGRPDMDPGEKFLRAADLILSGALPGWNDWSETYQAAMYGEWFLKGGSQSAEVRATLNTLIARGLFAIPSEEMIARWRTEEAIRNSEDEIREAVRRDVNNVKILLNQLGRREITVDELMDHFTTFGNMSQARFNDPYEQAKYYEMANNADLLGRDNTLFALLANAIKNGYFSEDANTWAQRLGLPDSERRALQEYLNRADREREEFGEYFNERVEEETNGD